MTRIASEWVSKHRLAETDNFMPCYSPLKGWKDNETGGIKFRRDGATEKMEVACGQCLGCRLDYSRMWAMRIVHESSLYEITGGNCFITLTYRDRLECDEDQLRDKLHIPDDFGLHKDHFQKFMKRLRKAFAPQRIRFYMCGEYGDTCKHGLSMDTTGCPLCNVGRPHYHACLFNCEFPDLVPYGSHNGELRYTSPLLESIWKYGFVDVGELTFESAAYVARYCLKKVTGVNAWDHYLVELDDGTQVFLQDEYSTMSRRPGIGAGFYRQFKDDMFPHDMVPVPGSGVFRKVPRYYQELFAMEDPQTLEQIKVMRRKFKDEHADEYTPERLMAKYNVQKAKLQLLKRTVA